MNELLPVCTELHYMELVLVRTQPTTGYKLHAKVQKVKVLSEMTLAIIFPNMCLLNKNIKYWYTIPKETHIVLKNYLSGISIAEKKE